MPTGTDDRTATLAVVRVRERPIRRWLLVVAVVAGLIAMHHLVDDGMSQPEASSSSSMVMAVSDGAAHASSTGTVARPAMDMAMHMCLAVLGAVVALVALLGMVATIGRRGDPTRRPRGFVVGAPPPRHTSVRLAQLCVLRT